MAAMKVLQKFYVKLITTLPMADTMFLAKLYSHEILNHQLKSTIQAISTQADKAVFFLDHVIAPSVSMGRNEHLDALLNCMEEVEDLAVTTLAQRIRKDLLTVSFESSTSYQSGIFSLKPEMFDLTKVVIPKIMDKWELVAESLHYDLDTIEAIRERAFGEPKKCSRELFKDWLLTDHGAKAGPKVWSTLINAIKDIDTISADVIENIIVKVKKLEPLHMPQDKSSSGTTKRKIGRNLYQKT